MGASQLCNRYKYLETETCSYQPFSKILKIHTICEFAKVGCTSPRAKTALLVICATTVLFDLINTADEKSLDKPKGEEYILVKKPSE